MATEVAATTQETETKTQGDGEQKAQFRHQEVGHKSLLQSDQLYQVTKKPKPSLSLSLSYIII